MSVGELSYNQACSNLPPEQPGSPPAHQFEQSMPRALAGILFPTLHSDRPTTSNLDLQDLSAELNSHPRLSQIWMAPTNWSAIHFHTWKAKGACNIMHSNGAVENRHVHLPSIHKGCCSTSLLRGSCSCSSSALGLRVLPSLLGGPSLLQLLLLPALPLARLAQMTERASQTVFTTFCVKKGAGPATALAVRCGADAGQLGGTQSGARRRRGHRRSWWHQRSRSPRRLTVRIPRSAV